jgi:GTP-binding protein HflX
MMPVRFQDGPDRAFLVGVDLRRPTHLPHGSFSARARESMLELEELARSAGAVVTGSLIQVRDAFDPATLVGKGKLDEVKAEAHRHHAPLIIVDHNLSPVQLRNIERITDCRVIDRTQLILDIFARRARSREGQLQVELAQLNYLMPRLAGLNPELSRLGGGIGTRGPGEQKIETDRRRIRLRVRRIEQAIETLRRQRSTRRQARHAVPLGTVALVGYTNAGKSTLFHALTRADVLVSSRMFATLDPTVRAVVLPSRRKALLSDTVGFIHDLPPGLIAAFRATLEEVQEASLILQVTDISDPHHAEHDTDVEEILADLGLDSRPRLRVFNKIDRLSPDEAGDLIRNAGANGSIFVSAEHGQGLDHLRARIDAALPVDPIVHRDLRLPLSDGRRLAMLYASGRVLRSEVIEDSLAIEAEIPESLARLLSEFTVNQKYRVLA